jgi:hypothetical protein
LIWNQLLTMNSLNYSPGALNTLSLFHRKKHVIYVEGPEDIRFWEIILSQSGLDSFLVKPAGGINELNKYTDSVLNSDATIVIARDSDYSIFSKERSKHPRVIFTYGHSIENSLQSKKVINAVINNYIHSSQTNFEQEIDSWHVEFSDGLHDLLIMEIANSFRIKNGVEVMGKSCVKLLPNNKSHIPCPTKTKKSTEELYPLFSEQEITNAKNMLSRIKKDIIWLIRGHFITSASLNFIKHIVKRERGIDFTMDNNSFYAMLISNFDKRLLEKEDRSYIKRQITRLLAA